MSYYYGISCVLYFVPDRHPAADAFLAANEEEQERIRQAALLEKERKRQLALTSPRIFTSKKAYNDPTRGRKLAATYGKLTPAMKERIEALSESASQRQIAIRLKLSRETVARALGKSWGFDKRKGRKR